VRREAAKNAYKEKIRSKDDNKVREKYRRANGVLSSASLHKFTRYG
jgi:adenine-specific DNA methylase